MDVSPIQAVPWFFEVCEKRRPYLGQRKVVFLRSGKDNNITSDYYYKTKNKSCKKVVRKEGQTSHLI